MKVFAWNGQFETGVASVDEQHRGLVDVINRIGTMLIDTRVDDSGVDPVFTELAGYATHHFVHEEELMAQAGVDARHVEAHRRSHGQFVEQLKGIWRGRAELGKPAETLHGFLTSWLTSHILEQDQAMARQIALIGQGMDAHDAYERSEQPTDKASAVLLAAMHELYGVLSLQNQALAHANERLERQVAERTRSLLQAEKMSAVGQLAAGVAHEINNPIGFVNSNLGSLRNYAAQLLKVIDACAELGGRDPALAAVFERVSTEVELPYLREDLAALLGESQEGLDRIKNIVQALKDFAHADAVDMVEADLLAGLESTLKVAANELKYKAQVLRQVVPLPPVHCVPGQINQVFMNLLVNAAQAIDAQGTITLRSGFDDDGVWVSCADNGRGITAADLAHVFEPFFTTKPVGQGTGLGLAVSWDIVVNKHRGRLSVQSVVGEGSCFTVWLPRHTASATPAATPVTRAEAPGIVASASVPAPTADA